MENMNLPGWEIGFKILSEPHTLIAGTTGSGKSTFLHSIIYTALARSPRELSLALIDLKRAELIDYAELPHVVDHAVEFPQAVGILHSSIDLMERRFAWMQYYHVKEYPGRDLYIIIDELADLLTEHRREIEPLLIRIGRLGRAARIHLIACTQSPDRKTITASIQQNSTCRIALHCLTAIESRQIITVSGAENLPRHGTGIMLSAEGLQKIAVPMTDPEDIKNRIFLWENSKKFRETY